MDVHYYIIASAIHNPSLFACCTSNPIIYNSIRIDVSQNVAYLVRLFKSNNFTLEDLNNILSLCILTNDTKTFEATYAINHIHTQININKLHDANKKYDTLNTKYKKLEKEYEELEKRYIKTNLNNDDLYNRIHLQAKNQTSLLLDDSFEEF